MNSRYTGETKTDKQFIISEFSKTSDVFIEIDGADDRKATKYRGKQVLISGIQNFDGKAITAYQPKLPLKAPYPELADYKQFHVNALI